MMNREREVGRFAKKETLKGYKRKKFRILKQLGVHGIDIHIFNKATNEIQVDNIALDFIMTI